MEKKKGEEEYGEGIPRTSLNLLHGSKRWEKRKGELGHGLICMVPFAFLFGFRAQLKGQVRELSLGPAEGLRITEFCVLLVLGYPPFHHRVALFVAMMG